MWGYRHREAHQRVTHEGGTGSVFNACFDQSVHKSHRNGFPANLFSKDVRLYVYETGNVLSGQTSFNSDEKSDDPTAISSH